MKLLLHNLPPGLQSQREPLAKCLQAMGGVARVRAGGGEDSRGGGAEQQQRGGGGRRGGERDRRRRCAMLLRRLFRLGCSSNLGGALQAARGRVGCHGI